MGYVLVQFVLAVVIGYHFSVRYTINGSIVEVFLCHLVNNFFALFFMPLDVLELRSAALAMISALLHVALTLQLTGFLQTFHKEAP